MDPDTLSGLERHINAERIAAVIAHPKGHSFKKHNEEFGGDREAYRQAIIGTLTDPETLVTKSKNGYAFYSRKEGRAEDNVVVLIDPDSPDWGTAFKPNGERGMKFLRERGVPINRNEDVNYLNKMNVGFFTQQNRLLEVRAPIRLNGLSREQTAEVALSLFDRNDKASPAGRSLRNSFDSARANFMPETMQKIDALPPEQKDVLRQCAHRYKETTREEYAALQNVDASLLPKGKKANVLAGILRDPVQGPAFMAGLEEKFAVVQTPEEEQKLLRAIEACETFSRYDAVRRDALNRTADIIDQLKPRLTATFKREAAPVAGEVQEKQMSALKT